MSAWILVYEVYLLYRLLQRKVRADRMHKGATICGGQKKHIRVKYTKLETNGMLHRADYNQKELH